MTELDRTLVLIDEVLSHGRLRRAVVNMGDGCDHHPSSGGGGGSSKGSHSDPTGRLVERHTEPWGVDRAAADKQRADRLVRELADLVKDWAPSNKATAHMATQASDSCPPGSCESCHRDGGHRTPARTTGSRMCKWCENWARELSVDMPPLMLVERHHQGRKITDKDVRIATAGRKS